MTSREDMTEPGLDGLMKLLDAFGADRSRWPARERLKYSPFIMANRDAQRLVAEAEALDDLLDTAAQDGVAGLDQLSERIMAAAGIENAGRTGSPPAAISLDQARAARWPVPAGRTVDWRAAMLLAASLALGVFMGTSGLVDSPLNAIQVAISAGSSADEESAVSPFDVEEEDIL